MSLRILFFRLLGLWDVSGSSKQYSRELKRDKISASEHLSGVQPTKNGLQTLLRDIIFKTSYVILLLLVQKCCF